MGVILLVEDSPSDAWLVKEAVKQKHAGVQIVLARDGVEATQYLLRAIGGAAQMPDLVLLDLNLPRKNGREVLLEAGVSPLTKRIPIVVLSSSQAEEDKRQAHLAGAKGYFTKPSSLAGYVAMLSELEQFWGTGQCAVPETAPAATS